jgi:hypothetical protein
MDDRWIPDSFAAHGSQTIAAGGGQLAHRDHVAHTERFERRIERVRDGVWSVIGNGLSNQNFVEGPEGLIAIDTGESVEEMRWALDAVREETAAPVVAVIYTHFHYVAGTAAIAGAGDTVPVWGHERIVSNRRRVGVELGPVATRGSSTSSGSSCHPTGPMGWSTSGSGSTSVGPNMHRSPTASSLRPTRSPKRRRRRSPGCGSR